VLGIEPVEVALRGQLGLVVPPIAAATAVERCALDTSAWRPTIETTVRRFLYNPGRCDEVAADRLVALLGELPRRSRCRLRALHALPREESSRHGA
jgi:hypothetical protein